MSLARLTQIFETLAPVSTNPDDYTTTNTYTDKGWIDAQGKTRIVYTILNKHAANGLKWKVLASNDNVTFVELEAEAVVAALASSSWVSSAEEASYRYFKTQVKSAVDATPATADVSGYAKM
jgi:hypothetical protein